MAWVKYICTYCGKKVQRQAFQGRPEPGKCTRRPKTGPHSWVKNG